jgi:hypothetical protein
MSDAHEGGQPAEQDESQDQREVAAQVPPDGGDCARPRGGGWRHRLRRLLGHGAY